MLLIGSGKPAGTSASESLLRFLGEQLAAQAGEGEAEGIEIEIERLVVYSHRGQALCEKVDAADLVVLASPVYVDSLPYLVTQACERIAAHREAQAEPSPTRFAAVINCGFPEAAHCETAVDIARIFARAAKLEWAGALAMGGGQPIGGHRLQEAMPHGRWAVPALTMAAEALARGQSIPARAVELMSRPTMPRFLYMMIGNTQWRTRALGSHTLTQLRAKPFAEDS
nr:NAD(P)H-dependent oxidoreductase [Pseudenhygromyxa sp. WMMC2535]